MLAVSILLCLPSNQTASVDFTPLPHGLPTLALLATSVRFIHGVLMFDPLTLRTTSASVPAPVQNHVSYLLKSTIKHN